MGTSETEGAGQDTPSADHRHLGVAEICRLLSEGSLGECQLVPWGSNYTFAVPVTVNSDLSFLAIYKPQNGESPLWDFPGGTLFKRELAAFLTSEALGWNLVPPTIIRSGPHGNGSVQLYIDPDEEADYSTLQEHHPNALMQVALFDMVINNADRKAGHCFLGRDGRIWGIDHGLTFHTHPKLRTVIWDFRGDPIPAPLLADVKNLFDRMEQQDDLVASLEKLLNPDEIQMLKLRMEVILDEPVYPSPHHHRHYPWPPY
jgi:uncharacterized repeat protein (TIGR03843 family)